MSTQFAFNPLAGQFDLITTSGVTINFSDQETPSGTIDGANGSFTVAHAPTVGSLKLYLNGQRLRDGTDYTYTGSNITMTTLPFSGDILLADYRY